MTEHRIELDFDKNGRQYWECDEAHRLGRRTEHTSPVYPAF